MNVSNTYQDRLCLESGRILNHKIYSIFKAFWFLHADFDPRKFLAAITKAMKEICKARYEAFGAAGQAAKIKPISLDAMATRYSKGELKAVVK